MSREVLLDLGFLTEDERDLINNVISKDAEIRKAEQGRIGSLRKELDELKENGLSEDELESKNEKYCARCQTYFGIILNRGAYCPRCELKVCKVCRVNDIDDGWICTLCNKVREVKAQSGAWFFQGHKEKNGNLFGSLLVRQSLRRLPGIQPKGHKEPSNPFIEDEEPSNPFIEDEEPSNPFTSGNRGRSSERLSGQADLNSNQAKWNGGHKMGYQYSDDSDEDSEQRSRDGSLEYKHDDTASDRTLSKGESDSSESLDSDHDVTLATNADELSPVATREMALRAKPNTAKRDGHSGGNVEQQGLPKDTEYEFGISKDTQDIRDRPPSFNQNAHQSGGNIVQKKLVGYTKSDEGTIRNTQKVRSRPGSLSLDEDMSYVSAPRFNIPLKRRQSSGSLPISEARSDEGFEKHRCRSEEYLSKSERMLDRNEPSADVIIACKKTRDEIKDQNISGTLEDVFGTGESNYKDIEIDLKDENKGDLFDMRDELSADDISPEAESDEETQDDDGRLEFSIHEDTVCKESGIVVESSPEILSENFSADNIAAELDMDEFTRDDDETAHKESGIVVDSSPNVDQPKQLSEQDFEIPSTDEKRKGSYDDSISDSDARQNGLASDLPSSVLLKMKTVPEMLLETLMKYRGIVCVLESKKLGKKIN
ncbi:synaptotagmin 5 [Paramuricea clavata]|uniref:Synaptotagmin 5 n=1 Tax=Paramuricea clavata TaxID=317549 RepID=A0A7D9I6J5_PARCT|nr:synaptotagmin 5 [Paramuricea clavata]